MVNICYLHKINISDRCSGPPSWFPVRTTIHWWGSTRTPYLRRFSRKSLTPPMNKSKNAQLTNPAKLLNPDDQENRESLGVWHLKRSNVCKTNVYLFCAWKSQFISHVSYSRFVWLGFSQGSFKFLDFLSPGDTLAPSQPGLVFLRLHSELYGLASNFKRNRTSA